MRLQRVKKCSQWRKSFIVTRHTCLTPYNTSLTSAVHHSERAFSFISQLQRHSVSSNCMNIPSFKWAFWCRRSKYVSASLAILGQRKIFGTCLRLFQNCALLPLLLSDYLYGLILKETSANEVQYGMSYH